MTIGRRRRSESAALALLCLARGAAAQETPRLVTVNGVAYDSLAKRPLRGALISVASVSRQTTSDDKGRWRVDSVPEGAHVFTLQHEAFDSLGLSGTSVRVAVERNGPRVMLAVPSFETLWRAACGAGKAPADSVLVYGSVRDVRTREPQAQANVEVTWTDLVGGGKSLASVGERRWRRSSGSDANGEYALCGVPSEMRLAIRASLDSLSYTTLELEAASTRVRRLDVLVGRRVVADTPRSAPVVTSATPDSSGRMTTMSAVSAVGIVVGTVVNAAGQPLAGAAIAIDSLVEVRSGADGRFVVRDVPVGTRQASVIAVGMMPFSAPVNVIPADTASMLVRLTTATTLEKVNVKATTTASARERIIDDHKRLRLGTIRDSTTFARQFALNTVFAGFPGLQVRGSPRRFTLESAACPSFRVVLDGSPSFLDAVSLLSPADLAVIEVYQRSYPSDLVIASRCVIVVWTKAGLGK